jgi:hypothetical protein
MKTLIAKPIINNQFWIVTDGKEKVGNLLAHGSQFELKMNGNTVFFDTEKSIQSANIQFQPVKEAVKTQSEFNVWPTTETVHNNVLEIKRKLHLFTKEVASKCYYTAGYFAMKINNEWCVTFCPKYIFIQRYEYIGPFKSEYEAAEKINSRC